MSLITGSDNHEDDFIAGTLKAQISYESEPLR
jgi:hypothetical protein